MSHFCWSWVLSAKQSFLASNIQSGYLSDTSWGTRGVFFLFALHLKMHVSGSSCLSGVGAAARFCLTSMQVQSRAPHSGLPYPTLPRLRCRSQLQLGSNLWPGNSMCRWVAQKVKTNRQENHQKTHVSGGPLRNGEREHGGSLDSLGLRGQAVGVGNVSVPSNLRTASCGGGLGLLLITQLDPVHGRKC